MNLESKIEAILFWKAEPVSVKKLQDFLKASREEVIQALEILKSNLSNRGIVLQENNEEFTLVTSKEVSGLIEDLQKEELNRDLSKASLETLSIILYKNGASRAEIDYIRGVNSSFTLRALAVRGLVEKTTDPKDSRRYIFKPSFEMLAFMGVTDIKELPGFEEVNNSMQSAAQSLEELSENEESSNGGDSA